MVLQGPISAGDSLFKQVTEGLAIAILSGDLKAGDLVPAEPEAAGGVTPSRSVYREALKYLSAKGLIEARQRSGTRVAPRSSWNLIDPDILRWALASRIDEQFVRDLYELRLFIEPNAARLAAERRTPEQLAVIEAAMNGLSSQPPYSDAIIGFDVDYHSAIIDAAGNPAIACLKSTIVSTLLWSMRLQRGKPPGSFNTALGDHLRVCRAIADQRPEQAHAFMSTLVHDALHDTLDAFRSRGSGTLAKQAAE
jgi:DNA-binding FadR family transcriptional regulator